LKDGGELSIEANYIVGDTNGQVALMTLFNSGAIQAFIVTFPGSTALAHWDFSGYVKSIGTTASLDGKIGFNCAIKLTGMPTLTAGAPA